MSTNISRQKREKLVEKINEIKKHFYIRSNKNESIEFV